jgi:hypothetical protein
MDAGPEPMADTEMEAVRRQARRVRFKAIVSAVVLTALALLLP